MLCILWRCAVHCLDKGTCIAYKGDQHDVYCFVNGTCCALAGTVLLQAALARQSRPTAEQMGLTMDPFMDDMEDLDTLSLRLEYLEAMMKGVS